MFFSADKFLRFGGTSVQQFPGSCDFSLRMRLHSYDSSLDRPTCWLWSDDKKLGPGANISVNGRLFLDVAYVSELRAFPEDEQVVVNEECFMMVRNP